uniref:palmitoyl-protein hydrolase n=1 Tax=Ascaris suum TaxID=6253 RepID=F1KU14_ASCSU
MLPNVGRLVSSILPSPRSEGVFSRGPLKRSGTRVPSSALMGASISTNTSRIFSDLENFCLPGSGSSKSSESYEMTRDPIVVPAKSRHTATIIFLHGLGDTGQGWSSVFADEVPLDYVKYICPNAPEIPVTLNLGMRMPAWFDLYGITPDAEEDENGINISTKMLHSMIDEEVRSGIPSHRIVIGGFSMGGSLALYAGLTYDKPLAGILGLSSFLVQKSKVPGNHTANREVHIFMGHGGADFIVPLTFGEMTAEFIRKFDPNTKLNVYQSMTHGSCEQELADVRAFLAERLPKI